MLLKKTFLIEDGTDKKFAYYRRPGIIKGPGKILVAYYEGQNVDGSGYQKLFCRISRDGGQSFGERIVLAEGGKTGMLHNIMMVCIGDQLHCFYNIQYRQLWHRTSADGENWSMPEDLSRALWRAETEYPWNAFGIGSGHGITLSDGKALIPTWFTVGGDSHKPSAFANIYSEDEFQTVKIGSMLKADENHENIINPNEGAVVELNDGVVMATVRHDCKQRQRAVCYSRAGIGEWSHPEFRPDLPDPICHASLERLGGKEEIGFDGILFCNCANGDEGVEEKIDKGLCRYNWSDDARKNLTLRLSRDGGRTFTEQLLLAEKGGYSDLAVVGKQIVCIYETGWDEKTETCIFPRQIGVSLVGW